MTDLRPLLASYARHRPGCPQDEGAAVLDGQAACTCGLSAALAAPVAGPTGGVDVRATLDGLHRAMVTAYNEVGQGGGEALLALRAVDLALAKHGHAIDMHLKAPPHLLDACPPAGDKR